MTTSWVPAGVRAPLDGQAECEMSSLRGTSRGALRILSR